jgi:hypothetical protein
MANITSPLPFIGVTPCRVADTRGNGFTGAYGPPSLAANATRSFTIAGQCGIPAVAAAVSFNFEALNVGAAGDLRVFPAGGSVPLVSTLNYNANTPNIANAAIVALGTGGAITVQADAVAIDLVIDLNGYYAPAGVGSENTFLGSSAGNFTMTGDLNTAIGFSALHSNVSGTLNTAVGFAALGSNSSGGENTAVGRQTLLFNTSGGANTAIGAGALTDNGVGNDNTAVGYQALDFSTGSNNIGIGVGAGLNQHTGSHDIYIGNAGVDGESNTIRIGDASFQDGGTIITGISGLSAVGGAPVYVTGGGRLGTSTASSRRYKQDIRDIAGESDRLMKLRPVAFEYKPEFDPAGQTQYGLIAEEVAEVYPDLVTSDRAGRPEGVRYHLIAPLLLNEVQKQRRTIESQQTEIEELKARLAALEARLPVE